MRLAKEFLSGIINPDTKEIEYEITPKEYIKRAKKFSNEKLEFEVNRYNISNDVRVKQLTRENKILYLEIMTSNCFAYVDDEPIKKEKLVENYLIDCNTIFFELLQRNFFQKTKNKNK